jgi:hypothetical protein
VDIGSVCSKEDYSAEWNKTSTSPERKTLLEVLPHIAHCLTVKIVLVFERNSSCNLEFPRWRMSPFDPNA